MGVSDMLYRVLADGVLVLHLLFILFVVLGGLLVVRFPWLALLHIPAAIWGAFIELTGKACPLTSVENSLRLQAGGSGYAEGFIEHYLMPVIYPHELARGTQFVLAGVVIVINLAIYGWLVYRRRRR